ncbi:MAG TPA: class I SAM-dependent methyltransferase [Ignavibacteria bacterium]|nr:class I SAM-dependent methyltransferase [Ignavibacteria bacterium]
MNDFRSTTRFSNRVENYVKYRPHYPPEIIDFLKKECNLDENTVIADIGSGTGISAKLFLKNRNKVFGVEPNLEMRSAAENYLKEFKNFHSIDGTAEHTTLESESVNMIVSGQAFHWFDLNECKSEFKRIISKNGFLILIWNERKENNDFMKAYYGLVERYGVDYEKINHAMNITDTVLGEFYSPEKFQKKIFRNPHILNYEGLEGRLLSSSYIPLDGDNFGTMISELKQMHEKYNVNGEVSMEYETNVYYGKFK